MATRELSEIKEDLNELIDEKIQFISPNEPMTPQGVMRVINQIGEAIGLLNEAVGTQDDRTTINIWSPNAQYDSGDIVLYFKEEPTQVDANVGKRTFAYLLISTKSNNSSMPNYDMLNGIPDFSKTNWQLLNPLSYILQDMIELKQFVKDVFDELMVEHINGEHNLIGSSAIEENLIKTDYSNLITEFKVGEEALQMVNETEDTSTDTKSDAVTLHKESNGTMEYFIRYSFDTKANQQIEINDSRYYYEKSPIWDESDDTIFSSKYIEDDLFSVAVNQRKNSGNEIISTQFTNLRYGTNIFHKSIEFAVPFLNDEYCVFFDTYGYGQFVFGYDKTDIASKTEPTYDAIVSMPMLMNKTKYGFDIVLPIHTYFNSIQQYQIGVPWENKFQLQAVGRYR